MEDWRTAVDERTGRTYWYHRVTRESTWTRPKCFDSQEKLQSTEILDNKEGYKILLQMLEGLGTPNVLIELLHEESPDLQQEATQLFLSCCIPSTVYYLAQEQGAIDGLVNIIMLTSTSTLTRRNGLRSLCCLALNPSTHEYFITSQGWISLAVHFMKWPDIESTLLFIILICLLLSGTTRSLITNDIILLLKQFLDHNCPYAVDKYGHLPQSLNLSVFDTHPSSQGVSLLDGSVLTQFTGKLNLIGGELPGTVLVTLAGHCLREEKYASIFISKGGINALQLFCSVSIPISTKLKDQGCELLATALEYSPLLRRRLVDMWASIATDLSLTTEVLGLDPLIIKGDNHPSLNIHRDVELRPRGSSKNSAIWRVCSSVLWSRCPGMRGVLNDFWKGLQQNRNTQTMYQGGLEISVDASEEVLTLLVHYIHSGLLPSLSASYPPLLLNIISTTDALDLNDSTSSSLSMTSILFELCRISSELQMTHLEHLAIQQYCEISHQYFLSIDPSTTSVDPDDLQSSRISYLQTVLRMCEKYMLERLHVNIMFLLEYGYPLHVNEEKILTKGINFIENNSLVNFHSPTGLRKAVSESVDDVTNILNSDYPPLERSLHDQDQIQGKGLGQRQGQVQGYGQDQGQDYDQELELIKPSSVKKSLSTNNKKGIKSTSKKMNSSTSNGSSKKSNKPTGGGIYKLLLQETTSSSGHGHGHGLGGNGFGTEVDTSLLETSSHSNDELPDYYNDYDYTQEQEQDQDYNQDHGHDHNQEEDLDSNQELNQHQRHGKGQGKGQGKVAPGPYMINDNRKREFQNEGNVSGMKLQIDRKGKTLNVEEFIRSQHSLAPSHQKKLTPAQKRLEEISKPKTKTLPKTRLNSKKGVTSSIDEIDKEELDQTSLTTATAPVSSSVSSSATVETHKDDNVVEKKTTNRSQSAGKRTPSKTEKKPPPPLPSPSISMNSFDKEESEQRQGGQGGGEEDITPTYSNSPIKPNTTKPNVEINDSVRASLQLLKKKPRTRGILARGSSMTESIENPPVDQDNNETRPLSHDSRESLPSKPSNQSNKTTIDSSPLVHQPPPPPSRSIPTRKPMTIPTTCTRNSDCTCELCVIPLEELPVVMPKPTQINKNNLNKEEKEEVMIGSSKLTTLQKKRQEMNKQKEGKKKEIKSAIWRRQSNQLRQAIASARSGGNGNSTSVGNTSSSMTTTGGDNEPVDDGLVPCPHCQRRFNDTSAQRHIPICKNMKAKPTTLKRRSGLGGGVGATTSGGGSGGGGGGSGNSTAGRR